ncbi:UvrD-helicase domain-containing protein [Candidatus Palauibacter sp.]|uniref:UvrD-helicase domain-containing protein n=1 Tax=Candidatus Palauibacter sp. TaxID=3101350 RepID=UPI003B5B2874
MRSAVSKTSARTISFKPNFTKDLQRLPNTQVARVMNKISTLAVHAEPDAKVRKRMKGEWAGFHRLRSGDYRVIYAFDETSVSLYSVRLRSDGTYDSIPAAETFSHGTFPPVGQSAAAAAPIPRWTQPAEPRAEITPLPEPVTEALLNTLHVPAQYHARLTEVDSQEALLGCPGVPDHHLLAIDGHMFEKPIALVDAEPSYVAPGGVDDLLRYAQGELVPFLLKLSPEQETHVAWTPDADGPTLLKGGPGTGKTTVALYRAREMIRALGELGHSEPRILFATFTKALGTFARELLESLLVDDAHLVDVRTVDSLAWQVLTESGALLRRPEPGEKTEIRRRIARDLAAPGEAFLFTEIEVVIQGRGIRTLAEYLAEPRPGRRVPLDEASRRVVWTAHEAYEKALAEAGCRTWQQARATAATLVASGKSPVRPYDAVIVDELQDLGASAIRLLIELCAEPNRLFAAADENQSIYTASFSWDDVLTHRTVAGVGGHVETLTATHRSTEQIIEGARDYLAAGLAEDLAPDPQRYVHSGPLPIVRTLDDVDEEADLLARYLRGATRDLHFTVGSSAVLVPHSSEGRRIAEALENRGVPAVFQNSRNFEFDDNTVQVLPLRAAKGLEFPVVAVAGFIGSTYPDLPPGVEEDAHIDLLVRERRTLFVAATRAMRALLVITPKGDDSMLFDGFDSKLWNTR